MLAIRGRLRLPWAASVGALVVSWLALTPSLLPRDATVQGGIVGVAAGVGYALGALAGWLVRTSGGRLRGRPRQVAWWVVGVGGLVGTVLVLWSYLRWENELRDLVGIDRIGPLDVALTVLLAVVVFVVLLVLARLLKAAGALVGRLVGRLLPARVATVVGALVVAVVAYSLVTGVAAGRVFDTLDSTFMSLNDEFRTDVPAPTSPYVSGGPRSKESWDDLGRNGRVFIANTPTRAAIEKFSGQAAQQPVRAYVGVGTDGHVDLREEARRAVVELERTGGFQRAVLNVATGTGRGWVNDNQAQALEYMWDGDTATVSMQYSYLPSWLSFLVDGGRARDAGRLLFDAVYAHWLQLPPASRSRLVVSGESLGSYGGEGAFSGSADLANRTAGALFVGPTNDNELWSRFTAERDPGTPEVLPVYDHGAVVRFADRPSDWDSPTPARQGPRVGYLQHANDPITWWSWSWPYDGPTGCASRSAGTSRRSSGGSPASRCSSSQPTSSSPTTYPPGRGTSSARSRSMPGLASSRPPAGPTTTPSVSLASSHDCGAGTCPDERPSYRSTGTSELSTTPHDVIGTVAQGARFL